MFTKQAEFTKKVTDLTDVPSQNMTPAEIKSYFQTPPDELKTTVNKLVDDLTANTGATGLGAKETNNTNSTVQDLLNKRGNDLTVHKTAVELDHPDESITTRKIKSGAVTREKVQSGAIGTNELDPIILNQPTTEFGQQAKFASIDVSLAETANYEKFYINSKQGKKIVMVGDSTTEVAPAMYARFDEYVKTGGMLEGATILNRGSNGNTLDEFVRNLTNNGNGNAIQRVIDDQANLYVVSYGINDIRGGISSPHRTTAQITADLKTLISRLLNETKGYILLRTPNTFIQDVTAPTYFDDANKAQLYSDQLFEIYESLRGYDRRVDVIDIPTLVFGRKVLTAHPYMYNALHPNDFGYRAIADEIAERITHAKKSIPLTNNNLLLTGIIDSITPNTLTFNTNQVVKIDVGDLITIGHDYSYIINTSPVYLGDKWSITLDSTPVQFGKIRIFRKNNQTVKKVLKEYNNEWFEATINDVDGVAYINTFVDLKPYNLVGAVKFDVEFDYYHNTPSLISIGAQFWINNTVAYDNIGAGLHVDSSTKPPNIDETSTFAASVNIADIGTNRYLHLMIAINKGTVVNNNVKFEFGNVKLKANGVNIDLVKTPWLPYSAGVGSVVKRITQRELLATKGYIDSFPFTTSVNKKDWMIGKINKASGTDIYTRFTLNISALALPVNTIFTLKHKYYTDDTRITRIGADLYFTNDPVNFTGGITTNMSTLPAVLGQPTNYKGMIDASPGTYQYLHLLHIVRIGTNGTGINFELGEFELFANGTPIDISGVTWSSYSVDSGSTLQTGVFKRDLVLNVRDLVTELQRLGLLP